MPAGPYRQGGGIVPGVGGALAVEFHEPAEPGRAGEQGYEQRQPEAPRPRKARRRAAHAHPDGELVLDRTGRNVHSGNALRKVSLPVHHRGVPQFQQ